MHPLNVLVVYGTTEGQTRKIAEWTAAYIRECGYQATLRNSAALASDSDLESFHAFIIAASVHQQQHQETITAFVIASQAAECQTVSLHFGQPIGGTGGGTNRKNMWIALSRSRIGGQA